ncbi:MAG: lipopolysaccharide transport periplasmic protein LptA [Pseudomonadota bacterium]
MSTPGKLAAMTRAALALVASLGLGYAQAQTSDRDQPLLATADSSEYSESEQHQILSSNVVITQGSLKMTADRIVIKLKDGAVHAIDATGSPVRFEQLNDDGEKISGNADRVTYSAGSGLLTLDGTASLKAPRQSLEAEHIDYNINSHAAAAQGSDRGQVNIVIQPPASEASGNGQ